MLYVSYVYCIWLEHSRDGKADEKTREIENSNTQLQQKVENGKRGLILSIFLLDLRASCFLWIGDTEDDDELPPSLHADLQ